jgi:DNA mismatch repair protein MutS2
MYPGVLKALEFDRIVEAVGAFAQTPPGAVRLAHLHPQTEVRSVSAALAATSEMIRFLADTDVGLRATAEFDAILTGLAVEGRALDPLHLIALAGFLTSVETTCAAVRRARGAFPVLRAIADSTAAFERESDDVHRKIDPSGEVVDDASPELKSIRERLRKQRTRLRGTLESYLRGRDTAKYLQQQVVTDRNGRYVLVVRAEHRSAIPGIVHGSSGSGASLFLEPLSTVEINNDIVALEQQEAQEVHRILLALTDAFRARAIDLQHTVDAATELDVLQARARLSILIDGVQPVIASDGRLELRAARHPLLIGGLRRLLGARGNGPEGSTLTIGPRMAKGESGSPDPEPRAPKGDTNPVPVDVLLIPPVRVLVITGPNTGGKTVALKTAGLLSLMAQAGLFIPAAEGSQVLVFRSVFADIGDEQSIAESLSTFSAHIANVVAMDHTLALPALVLLDEAGAGTDPVEGGALAMAVIEHFRMRGALVVATTHYDVLKSYASTTEGVTPAAFGFDSETFAPTYRLNYGAPGSSLAFEIATRLGLPASIIERARAHRGERESQLAEHLAKMEQEMQLLDHERRLAARERETLAEATAKLHVREQDLKGREETFRRRLDERIEERLRHARREIDSIVDALKARAEALAVDAQQRAARLIPTGESGAARTEARAALDAIGERLRRPDETEVPASARAVGAHVDRLPAVGDRVLVGPFGVEGIVQALHDREAEVDLRGKRLRARLDELRIVAPAPTIVQPARVQVSVDLQPRETPVSELKIIGCSVDEALARTEKFLDEALVAELRSVRLIHGYGRGQLRRAIAGFLQTHPFVANFSAAPTEQGGGGVTVVELKD